MSDKVSASESPQPSPAQPTATCMASSGTAEESASRANSRRYGTGDSHSYLHRQVHLGDICTEGTNADGNSTAEIAANAPRYRRKSSTFIDGIHDVTADSDMAPAQLYSTMSGRLFHSGRIAIVMVGLPARGKT